MLKGKKSRVLVWALAVVMLFGLVLTHEATAEAASGIALTSSGGSLSSGSYYLENDLTLTTDITIPSGATVTIDLNGYTLTGSGKSSVITVAGTLTLEDSSTEGTGVITGGVGQTSSSIGYNYGGGGVLVTGTFTMNGGTISGNTVSASFYDVYGGGVCVYGSGASFTMNEGTISSNKAEAMSYGNAYGGGVYVYESANFNMAGGTISGNSAYTILTSSGFTSYGGGVYNRGTFTMSGGTISGNDASTDQELASSATAASNSYNITTWGGGVYNYGTFILTDATISSNIATAGGGVYSSGTFTMTNSSITENTARGTAKTRLYGGGGGVFIHEGTFTMNSGYITDNTDNSTSGTSYGFGGGVRVRNTGSFTMNGGTISGNTSTYGAGVYLVSSTASVIVNGGVITENTASGTGGGIYEDSGSLTLTGGAVYGNTASISAADIYIGYLATTTSTYSLFAADSMTADEEDFTNYAWYSDPSTSRYEAGSSSNTEVTVLSGTSSENIYLIAAKKEAETFTVYYGDTKYTIDYDEDIIDGDGYDLTQAYDRTLGYGVSDGYLYAGLFEDEGYETPVDTTEVGDGLAFYPEAGGTYYVKEISDSYLQIKCLYAWTDADGIVNLWPVTGIDDANYSEIGFIIDDDSTYVTGSIGNTGSKLTDSSTVSDGTEIYSKLTVSYPNGDPDSVDTDCSTLFAVDGYLAVTQALDDTLSEYADGDEITMRAYYITQDGIMVTGAFSRTITFTEDFSDFEVEDDDTVESTVSYPTDSGSAVMVLSLEVSSSYVLMASVAKETTYTITKYDDGSVYTQEVIEGEEDVEITYAGKDGYLFGGWFTDESHTTAADFSSIDSDMTVYAKYVSADYMQVKIVVQSTKGVVKSLRFIAAVDSKNYAEVGFVYEYDETEESVEVTKYSTTVSGYTAVKLYGGDVVSGSKLIYNDFSVSKISAGTEITITPYWITLDGTTVYGTSRTVTYTGATVE